MASSSSKPPRKYEVFLSFRGEDTRNNFVSHLYTALDQRGIRTFFDEHNLESGQSISPELLKSIEESKFAIIVFSKNYASSTWCLDELVKIMECKTTFGQTVIPIFYDVDPSDVRKQKNSFGQSFAKHEVNFTDNMEKVQIWKENLRQAASIVGVDISRRNIPEASCIKKIVEEIFSNLHPKASTKDLVGIESRMTKLSSLLFKEEPDHVCFVGIWGMGGIGKTTIARAIFDKLIGGFEGGCFLQDVSKSRMVDLQNILLSNVLKVERVNISDVNQGSNMINDRFCSKRVLLILDDVDDIKQLKSLAGEREWFGAGSRIIITTRDKHLLNDVNGTYEVDSLSNTEAMQLFSWHAFKKNHPAENFVQLSSRVVSYACGLPLALEILGSYLHGRGMDEWGSALDRLKDAPEDKIFVALKISFEGLNDIQRDIFLDIACFFRGNREDEVKRKLHSFDFHPVDGITVLIQKSLIHMLDGKIQMHDLIQEMGWHIVRLKANKEPGRYSRLWLPEDIIDVLTNNTATVEIEGLVLERGCRIKLSEGAFRNMNRLRLLEIHSNYGSRVHFSRDLDYIPNRLRWLYWAFYPAKSLPENFEPVKLISLELPDSQIVQTPNFSGMPNLEVLNLSGCMHLLEVHPSIGVHKKLIHLNFSGCYKLKRFPRIIQMESLESLDLFFCKKLQHFPEIHRNISRLKILNLEGTKIREFPSSLEGLTSLRELNLNYCIKLRALPSSLCGLKYLECISLAGCDYLAVLSSSSQRRRAENHGASKNIKMLPAFPSLTPLRTFSISCFSCLQVLDSSDRYMLEALPELPSSIKQLVLDDCTELTRIPNLLDLLSKYEYLHHLSLWRCWQLVRQTNALRQSVPQFLSGFWDWEVLKVSLPGTEIPDWLYHSSEPLVTVTLSPASWYNDKLRGFALCAISNSHYLDLFTCNGPLTRRMTILEDRGSEHIAFIYIPIDKVTSGREREELKEFCLFEVTNRSFELLNYTWGIRLVYEGEVDKDNSDHNRLVYEGEADKDNSDLRIMDPYGPRTFIFDVTARLKVCVARKEPITVT